MREDDIREDMRVRLVATDAFSDVWKTGLPEDYGRSSGDYTAASIESIQADSKSAWDGADEIGIVDRGTIQVVVLARHPDAETRDRLADQLLNSLRDAVNGQSLAGMTCPDLTFVGKPTYEKATPPERRIRTVVQYTAITDGWDGYDASP